MYIHFFFFSSRRRHTRSKRDWSSDVCSSDLSSLGTLPVTIETLTENQGVEEGVASFTASLGANMGMNGCAGIYPALMAVTIANKIGRASCRERVWMSVSDGVVEEETLSEVTL